jgi:hypothetical protein
MKNRFGYCFHIVNGALLSVLLLFSSCDKDPIPEVYYEGDPIPGIRFYFPPKAYDYTLRTPRLSPDGTKLAFVNTNITSPDAPKPTGVYIFNLKTKQFKL